MLKVTQMKNWSTKLQRGKNHEALKTLMNGKETRNPKEKHYLPCSLSEATQPRVQSWAHLVMEIIGMERNLEMAHGAEPGPSGNDPGGEGSHLCPRLIGP